MKEIWKDIPEWSGFYQASSLGRIRSVRRKSKAINKFYGGQIIKSFCKNSGYTFVNLTRPGKRKQESVHRLVLSAFYGPCPEGLEACHNDGDRTNSAACNLRWGTRSDNHGDKVKHGTWQGGENNGNSKLDWTKVREIRETRKTGKTYKAIAKMFGIGKTTARRVCTNARWDQETAARAGVKIP